jgi:hypothetical protein
MFLFLSYVFHTTLLSNNPLQNQSADTHESHTLLRRLAFVLVATSVKGEGCIFFGPLLYPFFLTSILLASQALLHILSPVGFGLATCLYTRRNSLFRLLNRQNRALHPPPPHRCFAAAPLFNYVTVSPCIEFPLCKIKREHPQNKSSLEKICEPKKQR